MSQPQKFHNTDPDTDMQQSTPNLQKVSKYIPPTPIFHQTFNPKEVNDQYVLLVSKTSEEKLAAKKVKQLWKKQNSNDNI